MSKARTTAKVVFDRAKALEGIVGDLGLNSYWLRQYEEPDLPAYLVFARSSAQAARIGRKYFEITGTLAVWSETAWASRGTPREEQPFLFEGVGEFATDRRGESASGHRVNPKASLSRSDNDPTEDGR